MRRTSTYRLDSLTKGVQTYMTYYIAEIRFNRSKNLRRKGRMRKRLTLGIITLLLVSLLFSASILIISASACRRKPKCKNGEEVGDIIEALQDLSSEISELSNHDFENPRFARCQRKVLGYKVRVVIWQVCVGAYEGAINKLRNDIKEKIERWILDPCKTELIDKVEYIIELIENLCRDRKPPTVRIEEPTDGSYISGVVSIRVFVWDVNFDRAELRINDKLESLWTTTGTHTFDWNTTTPDYPDGVYTINLTAYDKAENMAEEAITVTVDNTLPLAMINAPKDGSFLRGSVLVNVTGNDDNFDRMESSIDDILMQTWTINGTKLYIWDTTVYADGFHMITLTVHDKAGNQMETANIVTVDNVPPTALIMAPLNGIFLKDTVSINVFGEDDNFEEMKLYIGGTPVATFDTSGAQTYLWNTSVYSDGLYKITLIVYDKTRSLATANVTVTVDNTPPTAGISNPANETYVRGSYEITLYGYDANLNRMELYINDVPVNMWTVSGAQAYVWNTTMLVDGSYTVKLVVYDEAGNVVEKVVTVTVDNTPPSIGTPTWEPEEPSSNEEVNVDVSVSEPACASGVKNVTVWYRTDGEWRFAKMEPTNDMWTATILGQSAGVNVKFYVEAYDNAGNIATTTTYDYTVKLIPNLPPVAKFTESAETVKTGETILFDASESDDPDGDITNYFWDFGDGTNTTGVIAEHAYADDGSYAVTLTVTDDDEAIDTATSTKTVLNRPPVASFTEDLTEVKKGEVIHFNASGSYDPDGSIVSYFWDFGDGTNATGVSVVEHAYADAGDYNVTLTVTDDDGAFSSMISAKTVTAPTEWPLALLAAIGLGVAALTATLLYGLYRRRKKGTASNPKNPKNPKNNPVVTLYVPAKILNMLEMKPLRRRRS